MRYITTGIRIISLIAGTVFFGLLTALLWFLNIEKPWAWGMIAGSITAAVVAAMLALRSHREHLKFMEAQSRVAGHLLQFSIATVFTGAFTRRAYAFFTDMQIRLFLWEKKPYLESTIRRDEVTVRYTDIRPNCVLLRFENDSDILLVIPDAKEIVNVMQINGYHVEEDTDDV